MSSKRNMREDNVRNLKMDFIKGNSTTFKKASIVTFLMTSFTFNLGLASEVEDKDAIKEIYHVYANNIYLGAVSDEDTVQEVLKQQEQAASEQYKGLSVDASSHIEILTEKVFNNETNDGETLHKLEDAIVIEADAFALLVDNEPIAYFKDSQEYEEAIHLFMLQFVTPEELSQFEALKESTAALPTLNVGETRLADISFEQSLTGAAEKVSPTKVITPEEAVKLLMTGSIEQVKYAVQSGDVLGSIAQAHGLKTQELLKLNPELTENTVLQIGQELNITVAKPFVTVNVVREKKVKEVIAHRNITEQDENMLKGETKIKQLGSNGEKEAFYQMTEVNGVSISNSLKEDKILSEAVDNITVVGTKVIASHGTGSLGWPAVGGYISSQMGHRWGAYHGGIDIARPSNYNILASDNGVVVSTGYEGSYGNKIVINHNNGYKTIYAHLSQINVSVGQVVQRGTVIGIMGSTGNSTGVHLHFEVEKDGSRIDPLSLVNR